MSVITAPNLTEIIQEEGLYEGLKAIQENLENVNPEIKKALDIAVQNALNTERELFRKDLQELMYFVIVAKYYPQIFSTTDYYFSHLNEFREKVKLELENPEIITKAYLQEIWEDCVFLATPFQPKDTWANDKLETKLSQNEVFVKDWTSIYNQQ